MAKKTPKSMAPLPKTIYCGFCLRETGKRVRLRVYSDEYRSHFGVYHELDLHLYMEGWDG